MTKCKLSVNVNKVATIRNARGAHIPDLILAATRIESYGAHGITVHPRPDERHVRYEDVRKLSKTVKTELNVEGYPSDDWMELVISVKPTQATLVPDSPGVLTSNSGWDTITNQSYLSERISELTGAGIRTSIFVDTDLKHIEGTKMCGAERVELYTEPYAVGFQSNPTKAVKSFATAAHLAGEIGLGVNAGHDLNLENLAFFASSIDNLNEVSIGHALISDALYFGLDNTVQMYLSKLS